MYEQYSIPSSTTATTATMRRPAQEVKTTTRQRFPQPQATYKIDSAANIPIRNFLVESCRSGKHAILWKQEKWWRIVVDDRSSSDVIGQRQEWYETFSLMLTMSMIITQNVWTLQQPFKDSNNSHNEPSSRGQSNNKTKIPTAPILTNLVPLLTSQLEMSWLKANAKANMKLCESRRIGDVLLLMIAVVAILDKDKNCVRLLVWCWQWA